ncbi:NgoFVII family restriction endonuclease [Clostridium botulinum]|uniref:restriction endonuclease PLD domain-containing protein n=1 Tax=Clostridium botulinum TaxID=1491 RepID=UPI00174ECCB2|nr:restriction endonuclease PLD domain-containing protein [Clostridium botulinum]MBD5637568.1 NgoFVII family restriction endonuclease [Clostridium botulinum]
MLPNNIAHKILFAPPLQGADTLLILSGYATPNMASWLIKSLQERNTRPVNIYLLIGMIPYDGLSIPVHDGFKALHGKAYPKAVESFTCSYVCENPPVHANLYIWLRNDNPMLAYTGSADFMQNSFVSSRKELVENCDPFAAYDYYTEIESASIYCNHAEVEDNIVLRPTHQILDAENKPLTTLSGEGILSVSLSLLTNSGNIGEKSGLNWGQRNSRNRNEAYIPLPAHIARSGFFPLNKKHFTVVTDDGHTLILRVEQQNNKAIATPLSNAQLGEYFRNRLNLGNGAFVTKQNLLDYGRTDITFYKVDEEQYFMDFHV